MKILFVLFIALISQVQSAPRLPQEETDLLTTDENVLTIYFCNSCPSFKGKGERFAKKLTKEYPELAFRVDMIPKTGAYEFYITKAGSNKVDHIWSRGFPEPKHPDYEELLQSIIDYINDS